MAEGSPPEKSEPGQKSSELHDRIYLVTGQIPKGKVATYGQVAFIAGAASARIVGQALKRLPNGSPLPWHRVVNSQGRISARKEGGDSDLQQRRLLEREGIGFDSKDRVDFWQVAWSGPPWQWLEAKGFDLDALALKSQSIRRRGAWCHWSL